MLQNVRLNNNGKKIKMLTTSCSKLNPEETRNSYFCSGGGGGGDDGDSRGDFAMGSSTSLLLSGAFLFL